MAKYRKISPRIWNDAKVRQLTDKGKLLFLFLLTHPAMTPFGAIRANAPGLAFELGWSRGAFGKALTEIRELGMAILDDGMIWFPNFLKYNQPESPNVIRSWAGAFEDLPECDLRLEIFRVLERLAARLGKGFREAFNEAFGDVFTEGYGEGLQEGYREGLPEGLAQGYGEGSPKGMPNQEQEQEQEKEENTASPCGNAENANPENPEKTENQEKGGKGKKPPCGEYYQAKSGKLLTGKRLSSFERFWEAFDFRKGKAEAADAWLKIPELTDSLVTRICEAAREEAARRGQLESRGQTPKWAQGWLSGRRWEDYETENRGSSRFAGVVLCKDKLPEGFAGQGAEPLPEEERRRALETQKRLEAERKMKKLYEGVEKACAI